MLLIALAGLKESKWKMEPKIGKIKTCLNIIVDMLIDFRFRHRCIKLYQTS
jgi:hypothetical protein